MVEIKMKSQHYEFLNITIFQEEIEKAPVPVEKVYILTDYSEFNFYEFLP